LRPWPRVRSMCDLSHRIVGRHSCGKRAVLRLLFPQVYRVLKARDLMGRRGLVAITTAVRWSQFAKKLTGPNQRWCWDISYLMTMERGVYLYLYLLLDEFPARPSIG